MYDFSCFRFSFSPTHQSDIQKIIFKIATDTISICVYVLFVLFLLLLLLESSWDVTIHTNVLIETEQHLYLGVL